MTPLGIVLGFLFFFVSAPCLATEASQVEQMQQLQEQIAVDPRFADYFEKIKQNPKDPQIHLALAQTYYERNLFELAIAAFQRALSFDASLAKAHEGLSHVYRKKKLKKLELMEMENAVLKDSENPDLRYQLAVLYMEPENFDYKKAEKQYNFLKKIESPLALKLEGIMQIER